MGEESSGGDGDGEEKGEESSGGDGDGEEKGEESGEERETLRNKIFSYMRKLSSMHSRESFFIFIFQTIIYIYIYIDI